MTFKLFAFAAFIALPFFGTAQTYAERFSQINAEDTAARRRFLEVWERAEPNAADMYKGQFVYYALKFLDEKNPVPTPVSHPKLNLHGLHCLQKELIVKGRTSSLTGRCRVRWHL